jgi:predicted peptidase
VDPLIPARRHTLLGLVATPWALAACSTTPPPAAAGQHPWALALPGQDEATRLWLYLPRGYIGTTARWPLVLFLHGSGERGTELERVKVHGPPKLADLGADYPFILASPQLAEGQRWEPGRLHALLQGLQQRLRIDPARVSATGLSLGGMGAWDWATAYPQDLAAIAPVCGYGEPDDVCRMRQVPVRAYHGAADTVVPLALQQACVDALRACGGNVQFTVFPGVGHDAWNPAYADPGLVPWLMAQTARTAPPAR